MKRQDIIKYSIIAVLVIAVIVLLVSLFTAYHNKGDDNYKELIRAKDELLKAKEETISVLKNSNEERDRNIQEHQKQDSLLQVERKANRQNININAKKYNDIPAHVRSLSKDSLRAAIITF